MGTLGFYVILGFLYLFGYKETFLKKSLDHKINVFGSMHDAMTTIWWLVIIVFLGIGLYYVAVAFFIPYLIITIMEYRKGRIIYLRESDKRLYSRYMENWNDYLKEVEKSIKKNEQTRTENNSD